MDRKELFFTLMNKELRGEGFVFKKSKNSFVKKENENEFIYKFEGWPYFAQVLPHYEIIIKVVEDVKKKAWGKLYKKYLSLGSTKAYLVKDSSDGTSWTDTEEAVRNTVKDEITFYHSFAKGYFKDYSNLSFLDKRLNDKPDGWNVIAYNHAWNSFLAVIVAKLNNNPRLLELIEFYKPVVQKYTPNYLEEYELLEKYLLSK